VVDKPFTLDTPEADQLIALAAKQERVLSVFQSRRLDSDFKTIQKIVGSGLLGKIVELESRFDRFRNFQKPNAWREEDIPGAGVLFDLGSHLIDQALTLFGKPESITAKIDAQRPQSKVDDHFELLLHYPGIKVTLKAGMLVREPIPRFILMGTEGSFVKYALDVQEEALKAGFNPKTKAGWGIEPADIWGTINTSVNSVHIRGKVESEKGDYVSYYQNIYDTITGSASLLITAAQARDVIRVIELARLSELESRTVQYTEF
jgi:predicted dehydrogenase